LGPFFGSLVLKYVEDGYGTRNLALVEIGQIKRSSALTFQKALKKEQFSGLGRIKKNKEKEKVDEA